MVKKTPVAKMRVYLEVLKKQNSSIVALPVEDVLCLARAVEAKMKLDEELKKLGDPFEMIEKSKIAKRELDEAMTDFEP